MTSPRGESLAAHPAHLPRFPGATDFTSSPRIDNQPKGLGFPHRAGQCRSRGYPFSSPGCRSCRCVECLCTFFSPGAVGFTNRSQSVTNLWVWGFYTLRGGIDPGYHRFYPRISELQIYIEDFRILYGTPSSPSAGNSRRARGAPSLGDCQLAHNQPRNWGFRYHAGWFRLGTSPFLSPVHRTSHFWSICMEQPRYGKDCIFAPNYL